MAVLDLEYTVPPKRKEEARAVLGSTIHGMAQCPSEIFARVDWKTRWCDIKASVCPGPSWVKICNEGFRPSQDELAYYMEVKEVFEDGLRRGLASVPLEGRMIDVPVYRRAQVFWNGERHALAVIRKNKIA